MSLVNVCCVHCEQWFPTDYGECLCTAMGKKITNMDEDGIIVGESEDKKQWEVFVSDRPNIQYWSKLWSTVEAVE